MVAYNDWLTMSGLTGGPEADPYKLGDYARGSVVGNSGLYKGNDESVDSFLQRAYTMAQQPGFGENGRTFNQLQNAGFFNEVPSTVPGYSVVGEDPSHTMQTDPKMAALINQAGGPGVFKNVNGQWLAPTALVQQMGQINAQNNANWTDILPMAFGAAVTGGVAGLGAGGVAAAEGAGGAGLAGDAAWGVNAAEGAGAFGGATAGAEGGFAVSPIYGELGAGASGASLAGGGATAADGAAAFSGATGGAEGSTGWGSYLNNLVTPQSVLPAAAQLIGAGIGANSAGNALTAQTQASQAAIAEQRRQYDQTRADFAPWLTAGTKAIDQLSTGIQPGGEFNRPFTMSDLNADPVYNSELQFGLDQGTRAIENRARAMGINNSGGTMKALTRFGTDYGSTKANDSFNRFQTDTTGRYNRTAGVAGSGQTAANTVANTGTTTATNIANTDIGMGNARGAASIAQGNAFTGGINNLMNYYQSQQLLNNLRPYTMSGY